MKNLPKRRWTACLIGMALGITAAPNALAAPVAVATSPLFLSSGGKANVLIILDNSNSMDEAANGAAVGSNSADSKSQIARGVIGGIIDAYPSHINLGLMAYRQNTPSDYFLHNSPYDASYDPAHYDSAWTGARNDATHKKFRIANPVSTGDYIHYNVALPFYSSSDFGTAFCYTTTSVPFSHGEDPIAGPWDTYRCFTSKTGSGNASSSTSTVTEAALGYSSYWFSSLFSPTDSDLAQGITDFGTQMAWYKVGKAWFRNDSPGRGYLHTPIKLLDTTQTNALKAKLKCNIPGTPSPCDAGGIMNAGLTPIEGTLLTAKDYFAGTLSSASEGYSASIYPLPTSCGKNYAVMLTDGLPSTKKDGTIVTTPATAISEAAAAATELKTAGVETYVVGFALPYGVDPSTLDSIAVAGGTTSAYSATDTASLTTVLNTIFSDIEFKTSSASAIATNSTRLDNDTAVFQAKFNSTDWSGQLLAYSLDTNGKIVNPATWDTHASGSFPAPASRSIYTSNPSCTTLGSCGLEFLWANLSTGQQANLNTSPSGSTDTNGSDRLLWLRGQTVSGMRTRSHVMGDIVNADPVFIHAQDFGYIKLGGTMTTAYITFMNNKSTNPTLHPPMLYVGSNDGMLHGFDANTGVEKFAYVPNLLMPKLSKLTATDYTHQYYVDAGPGFGDAYIDTGDGLGTRWRTILVGGLGAGGKGVYALDVTLPNSFGANKILWEFTHSELGELSGTPLIVNSTPNGWVAIFGNGYNSASETAKLFVVKLAPDLSDGWTLGSDYWIVNTDSATSNGLGTPVIYDSNGSRTIADTNNDAIYVPDLLGRVWKFRYQAGTWESVYKSGSTPIPLFEATDGTNRQPITAPLEIGTSPNGTGVMLYFGTGKYFSPADGASTAVQSVYGIWDSGSAIGKATAASPRSQLVQQTFAAQVDVTYTNPDSTTTTNSVRVTSQNPVTLKDTGAASTHVYGWYMDLKDPPYPSGTAVGERVVTTALLRNDRVIFTTLVPSSDPCSYGGTSLLIEVDAANGSRPTAPILDINGDGEVNSADVVTVGGTSYVPSGIKIKSGIVKAPAVISAGTKEYKITSSTSAEIVMITEAGFAQNPRTSWREIVDE